MVDSAARLLHPNQVRQPGPGADPSDRFTDAGQAIAWLDAVRPNLVSVVLRAADKAPRQVAWRLADALRGYFMFGDVRGGVADLR
jgi:hypothetical protein